MTRARHYLAVDLGAGSGRVEVLRFDGERLSLKEAHRFPNGPAELGGTLYWDALRLWGEVKAGLARASSQVVGEVAAVGVDTWGVDFAFLDERGDLLANPVCYRDARTDGMLDEAFRRVGRAAIFEATGIQFLQLNTLYQLLALARQRSPLLEVGKTLLMMPDLLNYWLSGQRLSEFTVATTTQCYDPRAGDWARPLLDQLGIPTGFLPTVVPPGTDLGSLRPDHADELGLGGARVVATASHDTASAVAAVPATGHGHAYISSGTWSLIGAELVAPRIDDAVLRANFTNEGGVGSFRFLKNVAGLWLVEECRRAWAQEGRAYSHAEVASLALAAAPHASFVDVDGPVFLRPTDVPAAIRSECAQTGQAVPSGDGAVVRCALESLALRYRAVLTTLESLLGERPRLVHVVGGGSRNEVLCQMTADATGLPVLAGPVEATAIGNGLVQMLARGDIASLAEGREVIARSFELRPYVPDEPARARWDDAFERYSRLYLSPTA